MKAKNNKYIIDIVPLTKIPLTRNQSFSYWHDNPLPEGALVSITFFKRKIEGIVLGSRDDFHRLGNIELKKVDKVIEEDFLTKIQIELAKFMSDYYLSPLGVVMKGFAPKRTKSRNLKHITYNNKLKKVVLTKEQQNAVDEITKSYKLVANSYLLHGPASSGKTEVYIHSIIKIRKINPEAQSLILVPEQTLTPQALERYAVYFKPEEIVLLSSNLSHGQYYSNWKKIKSGEAKIIIGTRMAVMASFSNLQMIVIDEEQDMSYKQWDMNPRYDARTVAEKLAQIHQAIIVRGSATPSLESYYKSLQKEYLLIKLPCLQINSSNFDLRFSNVDQSENPQIPNEKSEKNIPDTILVDMRKERWKQSYQQTNRHNSNPAGNYSCISKKLKSELDYALKYKQQAILFVNRQGMSSFSICTNCKTVLKCPQCDRALVLGNKGIYKCIHCAFQTSAVPECSQCQGITFQNIGLGTHKVEREISTIFPQARVARIDSEAIRETKNFHQKIYQDFSAGKIDVLVGTQMITKGWDLPRVALVAIIDVDNLLSFPDYATEEKAYQLITQLAGRVGRPEANFPGTVIIQTFHPENNLLKIIADRKEIGFYQKELEERELLQFPPFGKLIKLTFQDTNKNKTEEVANNIYTLLKKSSKSIKIFEPQESFSSKIRGRFRKQIVIKYKEKIPEKVRKLLIQLGPGWIIDIDPISII